MKLCERLNRRIGDREYKKWYVNLTKQQVDKLQWGRDQMLKAKIIGDRLIIRPDSFRKQC